MPIACSSEVDLLFGSKQLVGVDPYETLEAAIHTLRSIWKYGLLAVLNVKLMLA